MVAPHHISETACQVGQLQGGGANRDWLEEKVRAVAGLGMLWAGRVTPGYCGFAAALKLCPGPAGGASAGLRDMRKQHNSLPAAAKGEKETGSGLLTLQPGPDGVSVSPGLRVQGLQLQSGS